MFVFKTQFLTNPRAEQIAGGSNRLGAGQGGRFCQEGQDKMPTGWSAQETTACFARDEEERRTERYSCSFLLKVLQTNRKQFQGSKGIK